MRSFIEIFSGLQVLQGLGSSDVNFVIPMPSWADSVFLHGGALDTHIVR